LIKKDSGHYSIFTADAGSRALLKDIDDIIPPGMERKANKWRTKSARFYENIPIKYIGKGKKYK